KRLAELGYKQELHRGWSSFSNFAISFSIISVLAGCFTTFGQAWNNGGAGGIYYWASKLGGAGWGWFTGWFNLIGLVAVVASVDYIAADFIQYLLGLYKVNFIFNFTSTNVHYNAHVVMALFVVILLLGLLVNVFSSHLLSVFNRVSVWWHVLGVAVIVVILILVPSHHASVSYLFTHRINNSGFGGHMYWYYVLPLGFLLTMYTITGYDASAHVSEETRGAADAAAKGVWRSVFYSAVIGYIVLLALTFAAIHPKAENGQAGALGIITSALSSSAAKAVIFISVIGQLFCGVACMTSGSRMTFAFSRDGAIPGHN